VPEKWDGQAAGRIVERIVQEFGERESSSNFSAELSRKASVADVG
jgi:hypothetical protein